MLNRNFCVYWTKDNMDHCERGVEVVWYKRLRLNISYQEFDDRFSKSTRRTVNRLLAKKASLDATLVGEASQPRLGLSRNTLREAP